MPSSTETLHLCFGEAHEDLLSHHQVFAEHHFELEYGCASLFVIGASSIVVVEAAGMRLAEMIACGPSRRGFQPLCETGLTLQQGSEGRVACHFGHFRYVGEIRAVPPDVAEARDTDPRLTERLSFSFPSEGEPLTEIEAGEPEPGELSLRTVHEYPELGVRVLSRSRWQFSKR